MTNPRASVAKLLRAPWNFEQDYDEQSGAYPILFTSPFTPGPLPVHTVDVAGALDQEAALPVPPTGISPMLAKFVPCALGCEMMFSFPIVPKIYQSVAENAIYGYVWRVIFRLRSIADYTRRKNFRVPFSLTTSRYGSPDTRTGSPPDRPAISIAGPRFVRPAAIESAIYSRSAPSGQEIGPFFGSLASDAVIIPAVNIPYMRTPIYPGSGTAPHFTMGNPENLGAPAGDPVMLDYEQGERDPAVHGPREAATTAALHLPKFLRCSGNEYVVECYKYSLETKEGHTLAPRDWNFTFDGSGNVIGGEDYGFSLILGVGARGQGQTPPVDTGVRAITLTQ